nr:hypothetical protein [Candidatus Sigynarchaeota archaeon]
MVLPLCRKEKIKLQQGLSLPANVWEHHRTTAETLALANPCSNSCKVAGNTCRVAR